MPAALDIDREAVKTLCIAIGIRAAARQMQLPEATVQAWSARGKWFAHPVQPPTVTKPSATNAISPSSALVNELADDSKQTRIGLSRAALNAANTFAKRSGSAVIKSSQALRHIAAAASVVHGWSETREGGISLNLQVNLGGM